MMKVVRYLLALVLSLFSFQAIAHNLYLFAQYDGDEITGRAYYSDQSPAAETYVEAYQLGMGDNPELPIVSGKTDSSGHFVLPVTTTGPFKVVIDGPEGHRAERVADNIAKRAMGRSEFELLREDLHKLKDKIYLHDILGGIGYIFGLFGLFALLKAKREKQ